jgi:hypothetical protein
MAKDRDGYPIKDPWTECPERGCAKGQEDHKQDLSGRDCSKAADT